MKGRKALVHAFMVLVRGPVAPCCAFLVFVRVHFVGCQTLRLHPSPHTLGADELPARSPMSQSIFAQIYHGRAKQQQSERFCFFKIAVNESKWLGC